MRRLLFLILLISFGANAQIISADVGAVANATPRFFFSPDVYAQYHMKNKDYIGMGILFDWARNRETYVARYGTNLNKRWFFNSGIGFVNQWNVKNTVVKTVCGNKTPPKSSTYLGRTTYRTYYIGADYVFKKTSEDAPFNFYGGFVFTDELLYLKAGVKFGHEKRKK